jgi:hypothetical protein
LKDLFTQADNYNKKKSSAEVDHDLPSQINLAGHYRITIFIAVCSIAIDDNFSIFILGLNNIKVVKARGDVIKGGTVNLTC